MVRSPGKNAKHSSSRKYGAAEVLSWVHDKYSSRELVAAIQQISRDISVGRPPQLDAVVFDARMAAACYFRLLAGGVATLGGIRAEAGFEKQAIELLSRMTRELCADGWMAQAVVDTNDRLTDILLNGSGYAKQTQVEQLWLELTISKFGLHDLPSGYSWAPATGRTAEQLGELLAATFEQTLDCPVLNELRSPHQVLTGFLDDKELSQIRHWYCVFDEREQRDVGCLLLEQQSREMVELVYFGIVPELRGQQIGKAIIDKAISVGKQLKSRLLVAGADAANWPALKAYRQLGFQTHQSKSVFFRSTDVRRARLVI